MRFAVSIDVKVMAAAFPPPREPAKRQFFLPTATQGRPHGLDGAGEEAFGFWLRAEREDAFGRIDVRHRLAETLPLFTPKGEESRRRRSRREGVGRSSDPSAATRGGDGAGQV